MTRQSDGQVQMQARSSPSRPAGRRARRDGFGIAPVAVALALVFSSVVGLATPASAAPAWKVYTTPVVANTGTVLYAVSCTNAKSCFAVGERQTGSRIRSLTERWNGVRWSIVPSANPTAALVFLKGVSCTSATNCIAVGDSYLTTNSNPQSFAEQWNGTRWSLLATVNPSPDFSYLASVSCTSTTNCFAVGWADGRPGFQTLVEQWNGASWSIIPSANGFRSGTLWSVSCISSTNCTAAGNYEVDPTPTSYNYLTLVEHWDGSSWSMVASPNPSTALFNWVFGVSCTSATNCVMVGRFTSATNRFADNDGPWQLLVERWNGTSWSLAAAPKPPGSKSSEFYGVSCASATSCVAVGETNKEPVHGPFHPLIEQWNGARWAISSIPSAQTGAIVFGASCSGPTNCFGVAAGITWRYA